MIHFLFIVLRIHFASYMLPLTVDNTKIPNAFYLFVQAVALWDCVISFLFTPHFGPLPPEIKDICWCKDSPGQLVPINRLFSTLAIIFIAIRANSNIKSSDIYRILSCNLSPALKLREKFQESFPQTSHKTQTNWNTSNKQIRLGIGRVFLLLS